MWTLRDRREVHSVLAERCGVAVVELDRDAAGKPFVVGHAIHFNLSHAGDHILLAVAPFPVGIDIERIDRSPQQIAGLLRYFMPAERAALGSLPAAVMQCWTRKEAFVKAIGRGLRQKLDSFAVFNSDPQIAALSGEGTAGWQLIDLDAPPGYAATLAAPLGVVVRRCGIWNPAAG